MSIALVLMSLKIFVCMSGVYSAYYIILMSKLKKHLLSVLKVFSMNKSIYWITILNPTTNHFAYSARHIELSFSPIDLRFAWQKKPRYRIIKLQHLIYERANCYGNENSYIPRKSDIKCAKYYTTKERTKYDLSRLKQGMVFKKSNSVKPIVHFTKRKREEWERRQISQPIGRNHKITVTQKGEKLY